MNLCLLLNNVLACSACFVQGAFLEYKCENPSESRAMSRRAWPCLVQTPFFSTCLALAFWHVFLQEGSACYGKRAVLDKLI